MNIIGILSSGWHIRKSDLNCVPGSRLMFIANRMFKKNPFANEREEIEWKGCVFSLYEAEPLNKSVLSLLDKFSYLWQRNRISQLQHFIIGAIIYFKSY